LGIADGEKVRLVSRYGSASMPVKITSTIRESQLFTTFHDPRVFTNRITSGHRDRVVSAPEYKVTAVRVERLQ
jgi:formate dehydrogenase major subunit